MMPPRRRGPLVVAVLLGGALLAACSGGEVEDPDTRTVDDARIGAIVGAREQVAEPAQELGSAASSVAAALDGLVARPDDDTIEAARGAVATLAEAVTAADAVELDGGTEDVEAADRALADATEAGEALRGAAHDVVTAAEDAAALDDQLDAWVAAWDERGSRSELLARFDEVVAAATEVSESEGAPAPESCPGPLEARHEAAAFVASATADLREYVAAYDGNGFDARRAELDEAPFGLDESGVERGPGSSIDPASCPAVGEAEDAADAVGAALDELQEALNPADLSERSG